MVGWGEMYDHPNLLKAASELRRKAYLSLPWAHRIGQVLLVVAEDITKNLGRAFYDKFRENPEITGMSPTDKGDAFGRKMYALALRYLHNPGKIEDFLQDLFLEYLSKGIFAKIHGDIRQAESYVLSLIKLRAFNLKRNTKNEVPYLVEDDEGRETERVIGDPTKWDELDQGLIEPSDMPRILNDLRRKDPNLEAYFRLKLEDISDVEILKNQMLPMLKDRNEPMPESSFSMQRKNMLKDIGKVLHRYL